MATKTWNGSTTSWNTAGNWSPSGVPGASDDVIFDNTSTNNCTLDVAMNIQSLDVQSTYSGNIDLANSGYEHLIGGDATFDGTGTVDQGDSTITVSGNWDNVSQTGWTRDTGTIKLDGTSKTALFKSGSTRHHTLEIDGTITMNTSQATHPFFINVTINNGATFTNASAKTLFVFEGGTFTNNGTLTLNCTLANQGLACRITDVDAWGTINGSTGRVEVSHSGTKTFAGGTIGRPVLIDSDVSTLTFRPTGDITFQDDVTFASQAGDTLTIDMATNNVDFEFQGDISQTHSGTFNWTKGTGKLIISGSNTQTIDLEGKTVEDIEYDKTSGTLTFSSGFTTDSINVLAGSGGKLDFGDGAYQYDITGDATFDGGGEVDLGDAELTVSGNFDNLDQTTWTRGTSDIILDGTSKTLMMSDSTSHAFYDGTISGSYTIQDNTGTYIRVNGGTLTISGTVDDTTNDIGILAQNSATLTVANGGDLDVRIVALVASNMNVDSGATYNTSLRTEARGAVTIAATGGGTPTLGGEVRGYRTEDSTLTLNGDFLLTGALDITPSATYTFTLANNTNNPDLTLQGDVVMGGDGTITWNKGTGDLFFTGTAAQDIDFDGVSVEDWTLNKTGGSVTMSGAATTESFTGTDGTLDIDGNNLTVGGNFTAAAGMVFNDTTGGGLITISGNFDLNGISGTPITWAGPDLDITGTADADWTVVSNSDASAGTEVNALDDCTDSGGNNNWDFGVVASSIPVIFHHLSKNIGY